MRPLLPIVAILLGSAAAAAQTATTPAQAAPIKLAIVDTEAFSNSKTGIKRVIDAYGKLQIEIKPKQDEIAEIKTRYDRLVKEITETQAIADPNVLRTKADQAETLKLEIERKQQDGQKLLERRLKELTDPINADVANALLAFAKQRGIDIVLDASKFAGTMIVVNPAVDITAAFIADFNARSPVTPTRP